jgi:hypothetical protein
MPLKLEGQNAERGVKYTTKVTARSPDELIEPGPLVKLSRQNSTPRPSQRSKSANKEVKDDVLLHNHHTRLAMKSKESAAYTKASSPGWPHITAGSRQRGRPEWIVYGRYM